MGDYLPWVEKYRPNKINEILDQDINIKTIKGLLKNKLLPHLLFHGPSGTGKTSTIISLSNEIYGANNKLMVLLLDASDDRGINSVREEIKGFAEKTNMFDDGIRLIILDEADAMTWDAQFALRQIIEKYSHNVRFCIICNYENKIIPGIKSRCASFRFNSISRENSIIKLKQVVEGEKLNIDENTLNIISDISNGDLRKGINLLQSLSMVIMKDVKITPELCWEITGVPSDKIIIDIFNILVSKEKFNISLDKLEKIILEQGYSLIILLEKLIKYYLKYNKNINPNILVEMAELELYIGKSMGGSNIHIGALLSIFRKNL